MMLGRVIVLLLSYLWGGIPTAYLVARWARGIDIRRVGSGNVGGSNLRASVGLWATVVVGLTDVAKGALALWVAERLGVGEPAATAAGLAAVAGHNWSPWLNFQGGRGIGATLGLLLVAFPSGVAWVLGAMALGRLIGEVALLNGFGVALLPLLSVVLGEPLIVLWMCVALVLLMIAKRLEANQAFAAPEGNRNRVWLTRLLHDCDGRLFR